MTNDINAAFDHINRKLTASMCHTLQQEHGARCTLWGADIAPYARYCTDWRSICAILPAYLPDGTNGTVVYFIDGSCEAVRHRITWVVDNLLEYMLTSKAILERQSIRWMGGSNRRRVPLVVDDTFCLVPVTCRVSRRRNDGVTGYVVLRYIQQVLPGHVWRSRHRDAEDLLADYDNVLNRPRTEEDEISILVLHPSAPAETAALGHIPAQPLYMRDAYKLALRDSHTTVQSNICLAHQLLAYRDKIYYTASK